MEEAIPEVPGFFTQFFCLLGRRWRIFFRDRSQLVLQLVMVLLFPVLVAMFTDKGTGQIVGLSATQDVQTLQKDIEAQQLNMKTGSAVSGIIMFEVILLGLMGSNNAAREVAGERAVMEKEKYAGMRPSAYLASKLSYLSVLVLVQSVWMFAFVDFSGTWRRPDASAVPDFGERRHDFCMPGHFRPGPECGPGFLLSIYLVGFQLPLSGAVLALPEYVEDFIRPFISAYWAWSGSISALKDDVYHAVKNVLDTDLTPSWFVILFWACMLRAALRPPTRESAVRAGSFNLMRAFAGSPLYTSSIKNYVETACSKKKNFSSSALVLTVGAAVFVLAVIVGIVMFRAGEKPQAGSDIPLIFWRRTPPSFPITTMHWTER
ncbi:MAG: ABC transporter permease [Akkermansia sp.]